VEEVSIGSSTLSYRDFGEGRPSVVIISGMACHKDSYYDLQETIATTTRVLAYDRPGLGGSTPNNEPKSLDYILKDLRTLLELRKLPAPYVLIGHSLGGHIIRYFADAYPEEVAGLVFLDHPHEDWFNYIRKSRTKEEVDSYFKFWSTDNEGFTGTGRDELLAYEENCDLVRGMTIGKDVPVLMFTANNNGQFRQGTSENALDRQEWGRLQASLLTGVVDSQHIVDWELSHMLHKDKPEMVNREILEFIKKVGKNQ
jgi:pimeloyl-ACP methyl ester carboxylesterase